jgi:ketosteroid isomerase-like protein
LTIRLSSPDQLAIQRRGRRIDIASSRAPRVTIEADGRERTERGAEGYTVRTRAALQGDQLVVSSDSSAADQFKVSFEPIDNGSRLRVTRTIYAEQLNQPIVVQSIYDKVSNVARWDIYGGPQTATTKDEVASASPATPDPAPAVATAESDQATILRGELSAWIAATNARDIKRQMTFYMPRVRAFYLARDVSREAVRAEKARVFARTDTVDVRAAEPEIIFRDAGRTAIMRFRKQYVIGGGPRSRRGEVIQELRWQQTGGGWKIFSERDVKVIR